MAGMLVLSVLVLFAVSAHSYTKVCDVANTDILFDQTFKVYESRLLCEGTSFAGSQCSSYYLNLQRLLRSQLSFKKCEALEAAPYFEYAGTPDSPEGVFFLEQEKLSLYNNATGSQLRQDIANEFASLIARIEFLWESTRINSSEMITTQWSDTRTLDATEEQNNRQTASSEYGQTRDLVSSTETANRDTDGGQNGATREFDSTTEESTRTLVETQHSTTRGEDTHQETTTRALVDANSASLNAQWDQETSNTVANVSAESKESSDSLKATAHSQETANHALSDSQTASTIATEADKTQQTRTLLQQTGNATLSLYTSRQAATNTAWSALYSSAASLLSAYQASQNDTNDDILTLMIHIDLQNNVWASTWGCIGINSFGPVDLFTRPGTYFNKMRAVTNDTIVYNQNMYGYNIYANTLWYQAENARNDGNYRTAAALYSSAYIKAVTPPTWW